MWREMYRYKTLINQGKGGLLAICNAWVSIRQDTGSTEKEDRLKQ